MKYAQLPREVEEIVEDICRDYRSIKALMEVRYRYTRAEKDIEKLLRTLDEFYFKYCR